MLRGFSRAHSETQKKPGSSRVGKPFEKGESLTKKEEVLVLLKRCGKLVDGDKISRNYSGGEMGKKGVESYFDRWHTKWRTLLPEAGGKQASRRRQEKKSNVDTLLDLFLYFSLFSSEAKSMTVSVYLFSPLKSQVESPSLKYFVISHMIGQMIVGLFLVWLECFKVYLRQWLN